MMPCWSRKLSGSTYHNSVPIEGSDAVVNPGVIRPTPNMGDSIGSLHPEANGTQKTKTHSSRFGTWIANALNRIRNLLSKIPLFGRLFTKSKPEEEIKVPSQITSPGKKEEANASSEKNQAIRNSTLDPTLNELGLETFDDLARELGCRPDYLKKIGIISSEDLNIFFSFTKKVEDLPYEKDIKPESDYKEVQTRAHSRKENLFDRCEFITQAAQAKIKETNEFDTLLYPDSAPWENFMQKVTDFRKKLERTEKECDGLPKKFVQAFSKENYNALVNEVNDLSKKIKDLDRKHQIAKLKAYTQQCGILNKWDTIRRTYPHIKNLTDFLNSQEHVRLYNMGE